MRKFTFRRISTVFLVCALVVLLAHHIHRVVAHQLRTYPARASQPREVQNPPATPSADATTLLFAERFVQKLSFWVRTWATGLVDATTAQMADSVSTQLTVRVDFYQPNDTAQPDAAFFGPGSEAAHAWRWKDILLVDSLPGPAHTNAGCSRFQIRARLDGPAAILRGAGVFPVRVYRSFLNEPDDGDAAFANAFSQLFGAVETNTVGRVLEPEGETIMLRRIPMTGSNTAYFVSDVVDLNRHESLNPARGRQPASFAAFDGDALFTQYRETPGDEEPDGWAWCRALTAAGFVSAGLAHPGSDVFGGGHTPHQFALGLGDAALLDYPPFADWETPPEATRAKLRAVPAALQTGGALYDIRKNLGASKTLGRPVANGAFIVATGVQKLVVSARCRSRNGDTAWRMPGLVQALDGSMDQCLVRAPAPLFLFSGHGWDMKKHARTGDHLQILNSFTGKNPSVFSRPDYLVYLVADQPASCWDGFAAGAQPENKIVLAEKWRKDEVRLQWVFFLGCYVLDCEGDPFADNSNADIFGRLIVDRLGAKGVIGFAEHGFTSVSFLQRFVNRARQQPVTAAWMGIWNDVEAKAYHWYEQNEEFGRSARKGYSPELRQMMPAYLVRQENAAETLTPENMDKAAGGAKLRFGILTWGTKQEFNGEFKGRMRGDRDPR
ncbi:MAG: hypothetical protein WCI17_01665 [bacterium]|jgi:hypothetical protein